MTKKFTSYADMSRQGWGRRDFDPKTDRPTDNEFMIGALQRIADAVESLDREVPYRLSWQREEVGEMNRRLARIERLLRERLPAPATPELPPELAQRSLLDMPGFHDLSSRARQAIKKIGQAADAREASRYGHVHNWQAADWMWLAESIPLKNFGGTTAREVADWVAGLAERIQNESAVEDQGATTPPGQDDGIPDAGDLVGRRLAGPQHPAECLVQPGGVAAEQGVAQGDGDRVVGVGPGADRRSVE